MDDYPRFHQDRLNLAIHAVMVPVFLAGALGAAVSLAFGHWLRAALLLVLSPLSMAVQGYGHRREPVPPLPFLGPADVMRRILTEQFFKFPRFVLGGGWARAWRGSPAPRDGRAP
jgi:hypothetical protein